MEIIKILTVYLLLITLAITCNSPKTKDQEVVKTTIPEILKTKTGYELRGHQLDSVNAYRQKLGLPKAELVIYDTAYGMTTIEYYKDGSLVTETNF